MKNLIKFFSILILVSISHVAIAIDNVDDGDLLTAEILNEIIDQANLKTIFTLPLNGDQVIPEVISNMTAEARISFDPGMRFAEIFMNISDNFFGVTGVSLNLGEAGKNGDVVVQVEDFSADPIITRSFTVAEIINASEVNKVDTVINIASLFQAVRDGRIYIAVTSVNFPDGEIRGQIFP
jgi:hypothetical protein